MSTKFAYFKGCVADQSAKENDMATRAVCKKIGIELKTMPFHCCGGGLVHEVDNYRYRALNEHNLDIAENEGLDIMTICSVCNYSLKLAGREYGRRDLEIKSLEEIVILEIGLEKLKESVVRKFEGTKIAPFYGCKSLRPAEFNPFGDSADPHYLEDIILGLGGNPVKYSNSRKCCGFPNLYVNKDVAIKLSNEILRDATENNAELIITPCPLCQMMLDIYQKKNLRIPVLHFSQFLGLALGISKKELGLGMNMTSTESLTG